MTKDDILALLGKQMQVRVTSNEKVEETLETAGENDIVLVPEEKLHIHTLRLRLGDTGAITLPFYSYQKEEFTQDDIYEKIVKKVPEFSMAVYGLFSVVLWVQIKDNGTASYQFSKPDGTAFTFTGVPTLISDTVTEV